MNKSESKYFNTALLMDEALLELLTKKDFEFINVKEICEKAGVNRSTFYLHYQSISDLLSETTEMILKRFCDSFIDAPNNLVDNISYSELDELLLINDRYLLPYLQFIYENKTIYKASVKNKLFLRTDNQYDNLSTYVIKPIMTRFKIPENEQKYWITFYIDGIHSIIAKWVKDDCKDSVEFIAEVIIKCVGIRRNDDPMPKQ